MTVSQLIEKLSEYNGEANVVIIDVTGTTDDLFPFNVVDSEGGNPGWVQIAADFE